MVIFGYEGCEDVFHPNLCFIKNFFVDHGNAAVIGREKCGVHQQKNTKGNGWMLRTPWTDKWINHKIAG